MGIRSMSSFRWALVFGLAMAFSPLAARAQGGDAHEEARTRQGQGEAFFEADNYDAALVEFQRVYELLEGNASRYVVLFNIGQCQERLFRYDDALRSYQGYLDEGGPDADDRAGVEATIHALDGMLATLSVETNVEGGEIWVDGRRVGTAPASVRVPPGNHSIEVRSTGFSPGRQEVQVSSHASRTLRFVLEALGGGIHPAFFITGAVATAAALAVGIGFGVEALAAHDSTLAMANSSDPAISGRVYEGDLHHIADLALVADVLYGVSGALAIGSLVMLLVTDWGGGATGPPAATALWIIPSLGSQHAGLRVGGSF